MKVVEGHRYSPLWLCWRLVDVCMCGHDEDCKCIVGLFFVVVLLLEFLLPHLSYFHIILTFCMLFVFVF